MKKTLFAALLVVTLTACTPAPPTTDIQSTAIAIVQTGIALTQTALPTSTPSPIFTPTATIVVYPSPSPIPTFPPLPILTPDAIQVERWQEYQAELIKAVLSGYDPALYNSALCEWDILGRSGQEVYVWAYCAIRRGGGASRPAVISLKMDEAIRTIRVAGYKGSSFDLGLFPLDVQKKRGIYTGDSLFWGRIKEMVDHIHYRESHPEEPPLVILSTMPMVTPTP